MNDIETQAVTLAKSVSTRFIKGGVAGAIAALTVITIKNPTTWTELSTALVTLAYAVIMGFFSGGVLAVEKWYSWTPAE